MVVTLRMGCNNTKFEPPPVNKTIAGDEEKKHESDDDEYDMASVNNDEEYDMADDCCADSQCD